MKYPKMNLLGISLATMLVFTGCSSNTDSVETSSFDVTDFDESDYKLIEAEGGDLSGDREPNSKVDIGYGDREYYAYTNEYGQVIYVTAEEIINQDDDTEDVTSEGRYYSDEAKVPGTEASDMDEGHLIADSLGGVSNAYNITPQYYTVNRGQDEGDMRPIEEQIHDNGATDLTVVVTYPSTDTQTPTSYEYQFTSKGKEYDYVVNNHESEDTEVTNDSKENSNTENSKTEDIPSTSTNTTEDKSVDEWLRLVDSNQNHKITVSEVEAYGIPTPIYESELPNLYSLMYDGDNDGAVGE